MSTFKAKILTPEGSVFEGEVSGVKMPGTQGSFEVKTNHAPIVSTLQAGRVTVRSSEGEQNFQISGGMVESASNELTLLAESVELQS
ncbi:MAG: F0F1 ATP synthase subunit epsilon [Bacteroidetes bacterium]|jgi:F-type H+-transporting ATPase subunit epsilon|nr:F0F1 ATP synthase subunit epsilon [Bacteroidota bacterium]